MIPAHPIKLQTPKNLLLNGLWFGPAKPKTVLVIVHGLSGTVFSQAWLAEGLANKDTAALVFNNRGSGVITRFKQLDAKSDTGYQSLSLGMAHEVFTDCVDDLEGAVQYAKAMGAKQVILVGHSTGCQKSVYYLSKRPNPIVKGVILLAPMSDFADMYQATEPKLYKKLVALASRMVAEGRAHELMLPKLWPAVVDAQRFLSLHTVESEEEIFTYGSGKKPATLKKVNVPLLVVLAGKDEYEAQPMGEIAEWFKQVLKNQPVQHELIPGASHGFFESTAVVTKLIKAWLKLI